MTGSPPIVLGVIDVGSNAIRVAIAEAASKWDVHQIKKKRFKIRLGTGVFSEGRFDHDAMDRAVEAFGEMKAMFEEFGVTKSRAVATSATREAENSPELIERIRTATGIELEIIDGEEEAALIQKAVLGALGDDLSPAMILDLGGGSLEIDLYEGEALTKRISLPLGAVRFRQRFSIEGPISDVTIRQIEQEIREVLIGEGIEQWDMANKICVATGGNAKTLTKVCPGDHHADVPSLDLIALAARLTEIAGKGIEERRQAYGVSRDHAEVMAIAAVIFVTISKLLELDRFYTPVVGLKEGLMLALAENHFLSEDTPPA